jgi:hypothetical protein
MRRLLLVLVLATACKERPPPAGGPCRYEPFVGRCKIVELQRVPAPSGRVALEAAYQGMGARGIPCPARVTLEARVGDEVALREHFSRYDPIPCRGSAMVEGSCNPCSGGGLEVKVPAFQAPAPGPTP